MTGLQQRAYERIPREKNADVSLLASDILDLLHEAVLILTPTFDVERANKAFLQQFRQTRDSIEGKCLWEIGDVWGISVLRHLLEDRLPAAPDGRITDIDIVHDFQDEKGESGYRSIRVNAYFLRENTGSAPRIVLAVEDRTDQKRTETENAHLRAMASEEKRQRDEMLRDVLSSATDGKLILCSSEAELPSPGNTCVAPFLLTLPNLRDLRHRTREAAEKMGITPERVDDFETAVGEAAMNAVVHAGGGIGRVHWIGRNNAELGAPRVQVWVSDFGKGIRITDIPRAALEKGFSSTGTMGQGFKIILRTADRIYLFTSEKGTTVVMEQEKEPPLPPWLLHLPDGGF